MQELTIECDSCGRVYGVKFDIGSEDPSFCPFCGQEVLMIEAEEEE